MSGNRILASIVRTGGGRLLNAAVGRLLPDEPAEPGKRRNLLGGIAGTLAMRVATRSVPGAIVVGSGVLAKKLYDKRRAKQAQDAAAGAPAQKESPPKA